MRALHAEQRPRSTAQERTGMFSNAEMPWPQAGHWERGTKRLYRSAGFAGGAEPSSSAHSCFQSRSMIFGRRWMTTLRKEPTTRPTRSETQGNTAGWATAWRVSLIRAGWRALLDRLADLEYRQIHRDDHAADQH